MVNFRDRLISLLSESGMSQVELASKIHITPASVCKWKKGKAEPDHNNLRQLRKELNVSIDYLLGASDCKKPRNESISKETHLSEKAIETLRYEASPKRDSRRMVMLNLILSDRAVFESLMDCLSSLCWPSGYLINTKKSDLISYPVKNPDGTINRDHIAISPKAVKMFGAETPDNIYSKMRQTIEAFRKTVPDWSSVCEDIVVEDEDEDSELTENEVRQIVASSGNIPSSKVDQAVQWIMDQYQEEERRKKKDKQPVDNEEKH